MSEQHLSTRSKTCMHLENFKFFQVFTGHDYFSSTSGAINEQVFYKVPLLTLLKKQFCGKCSRISKDSFDSKEMREEKLVFRSNAKIIPSVVAGKTG